MNPAIQKVQDALTQARVNTQIIEFEVSTRTSHEAAAAIGTSVSRIVKSLVFLADGEPILILVSGSHRVSTSKLGHYIGKRIQPADATAAKEATGFAIGSVPPVGHTRALPVYLDADLLKHDLVYAAAGTPHAVFPITPQELAQITNGRVMDLKEE